jgi:hypothetical protein
MRCCAKLPNKLDSGSQFAYIQLHLLFFNPPAYSEYEDLDELQIRVG